jgi:hypothetical protein
MLLVAPAQNPAENYFCMISTYVTSANDTSFQMTVLAPTPGQTTYGTWLEVSSGNEAGAQAWSNGIGTCHPNGTGTCPYIGGPARLGNPDSVDVGLQPVFPPSASADEWTAAAGATIVDAEATFQITSCYHGTGSCLAKEYGTSGVTNADGVSYLEVDQLNPDGSVCKVNRAYSEKSANGAVFLSETYDDTNDQHHLPLYYHLSAPVSPLCGGSHQFKVDLHIGWTGGNPVKIDGGYVNVLNGSSPTTTLSHSQPHRLLQSTGNLYWTADQTVQGRTTADVYRAPKTNEPGQEQVLHQELSLPTSRVDFEAITYANVGGTWYGYFVANYVAYLHQEVSQIKRVPLAGGAAVVLATSPAVVGNRDLVTDGSFLYWADAGGIRKKAITGGKVTTLVSGQGFAHLALDGPVLYYSSADSILTVPVSGGTPALYISGASPVTAIYAVTTDNGLLWGEANGSVNAYYGGDISDELQLPVTGLSITSVSAAGNYILWSECFSQLCQVVGQGNGTVVSVTTPGTPVVDAQGDVGAWYWGDSAGVEKFAP